ncbi:MAG: cohesin domain-containing protein [bacterium]|nr:cohesin domain-containing protein [bacterium]
MISWKRYEFTLNHLPSPLQKFIIAFLSVIFLLLVVTAIQLYITPQSNPPLKNPPTSLPVVKSVDVPRAKLSIKNAASQGSLLLQQGDIVTIGVELTGNEADAVDIKLRYDPRYLTYQSHTPGTLFKEILMSSQSEGEILMSASIDPNSTPVGNGKVMTAVFKAMAPGSSSVFLVMPDSAVRRNGENILNVAESLQVVVE